MPEAAGWVRAAVRALLRHLWYGLACTGAMLAGLDRAALARRVPDPARPPRVALSRAERRRWALLVRQLTSGEGDSHD